MKMAYLMGYLLHMVSFYCNKKVDPMFLWINLLNPVQIFLDLSLGRSKLEPI